jgi:hypothetical protein
MNGRRCYLRTPARIVGTSLGRRLATLDVVFVENGLGDHMRRAIVPTWIVVVIEPDGGDRSLADIGATPPPTPAKKLTADAKI